MIPLATPNLTGKETEYVTQAIASGWVGPDGPFVAKFEAMIEAVCGRTWAVAVVNGTAALRVAATVLRFDSPVKVPRLAFPAMRNVLRGVGCEIVEIDGGEDHDRAIYRSAPRAAMVADRAPAIGSRPTTAAIECYSFAANKTVTCGHGGALVGDDPMLEGIVRNMIRQGHGRDGVFNYRMANLNAAMGCAQMERLDELRAAKRRIWDTYRDAGLPMVERGASRWMSTIKADESLVPYMREKGIECRVEPGIGVSLPCSTHLSEQDQARVIEAYSSFRAGVRMQVLSPLSSASCAMLDSRSVA